MLVKHKKLNLPLLTIVISNCQYIEDKNFYEDLLDNIYESIFKHIPFYDMYVYKDNRCEVLSFYYEDTEKANKHLSIIYEYLDLIKETERKTKIQVTLYDRKDMQR